MADGGATMLTHAFPLWRVILAWVIVALLIAALPQATDAALTKRQRCIAAAERALGHDIRASDYRIVLGTDRDWEELWPRGHRKDLICGFGGSEEIPRGAVLRRGDIFISGKGGSLVRSQEGGLVVGGDGPNTVQNMSGGRFEGRGGQDMVESLDGGVFLGGDGADDVIWMYGGRFIGGRGADEVHWMHGGVFRGKRGFDRVRWEMHGGTFYGGSGTDKVRGYVAGKLYSVEVCRPAKACP